MKLPSFLACLLLLFVACKKNHQQLPTAIAADIFPDRVGDKWVYEVTDSVYLLTQLKEVKHYNMTVQVSDSLVLPGGTSAHRWVYTYPGGIDTNYVYHHGDTISYCNLPSATGNSVIKQYIVPFSLQQSWPYTGNSVHHIIVSAQAAITVGPFIFGNAFDLTGNPGRPDDLFRLNEWVASNVGVVKRYFNNRSSSTNPYQHIITWTILNYDLN